MLVRPSIAAACGPLFALLAGLALCEAIEMVCDTVPKLVLKWPNDVMIGEAKLGGILLDAEISGDRIDWLVIGCGANLVHAPEIPGRQSVALGDFITPPSPGDLVPVLLSRVDYWRSKLESDHGAMLRAAWLLRAHPAGTKLGVDAGRMHGAFVGIDDDGALQIADDSGHIATIRSGDVELLRVVERGRQE